MSSSPSRIKKGLLVQDFISLYSSSSYLFLIGYTGVDASTMYAFRAALRTKCGVRFNVIKNTLNKISVSGTEFDSINSILHGQLGVIACNDPIPVASVLAEFTKSSSAISFSIACLASGHASYNSDTVSDLSSLGSVDALRSKLLSILTAPGSRLVGVLEASLGGFLSVLNSRSDRL